MQARLDPRKVAPDAMKVMSNLHAYVGHCGLDHKLIKLRASQINGCAWCLDMHTKDARAAGETEQRLYLLSTWREAPFYSERERAALAWTEAVTRVSDGPIEDDLYAEVRHYFSEKELADLTLAVVAINGWNRLAISFRRTVGSYRPPRSKAGSAAAAS